MNIALRILNIQLSLVPLWITYISGNLLIAISK